MSSHSTMGAAKVISGLPKQAVFIPVQVILILALLVTRSPSHADDPELPAPLCALVNAQVVCYDAQTAAAQTLTPDGQHVVDYGISPDGEWLVYRIDSSVIVTAINTSAASLIIDANAAPSAELDPLATTLAWSPDGLAIAYLIAGGFRVAFPPLANVNLPPYVDKTDRPFTDLRFSPDGSQLAAQSDDGSWSVFQVNSSDHALQRTRTIEQSAELVWLDNTSLIIAPLSGGVLRLNGNDSAPVWTIPDDHFIKLIVTSAGQVFAIHPDPDDTIGSAVAISAAGKVTPLGDSKIDSRVRWGPDGQMMVYIVSGTPILVDRGTGAEDMLPIKDVTRLAWFPPPPKTTITASVDADLYFLAPDKNGITQLWRLSRGEPIRQITREAKPVEDYAISPDKSQFVIVSSGNLSIASFAEPTKMRRLVSLHNKFAQSGTESQLDWRSDGLRIAYIDGGVYILPAPPHTEPMDTDNISAHSDVRPIALQLDNENFVGSYQYPRFSRDGRYLTLNEMGQNADCHTVIVDMLTKQPRQIALCSQLASWGVNDVLLSKPVSGTGLVAIRAAADSIQPLAEASWIIPNVHPMKDGSVLFLRNIGWQSGPDVVMAYAVTPDGTDKLPQAAVRSKPAILSHAQISSGGRFAAGLQRLGKINQLVILDLQTGQKVRIQDGNDVSSLYWSP
ncbi:MAG: WD40 repeat domain-containing protein [Chloroflexota bacterium]